MGAASRGRRRRRTVLVDEPANLRPSRLEIDDDVSILIDPRFDTVLAIRVESVAIVAWPKFPGSTRLGTLRARFMRPPPYRGTAPWQAP